jgi:hypothetical protein
MPRLGPRTSVRFGRADASSSPREFLARGGPHRNFLVRRQGGPKRINWALRLAPDGLRGQHCGKPGT